MAGFLFQRTATNPVHKTKNKQTNPPKPAQQTTHSLFFPTFTDIQSANHSFGNVKNHVETRQ
jgi:hypothetical protein